MVLYFMDSTLQDAALDQAYEDMVSEGMPTSQIEQGMQVAEMLTGPVAMFFWALIFGILFSLIWPLITSGIVQRKHPLD